LRRASCRCRPPVMTIQMALSGPMKILLVQDSAMERHQVSRYLKDLRLDPVVMENGTDAWQVLRGPICRTSPCSDRVCPEWTALNCAAESGCWGRTEPTSTLRFAATHDFLTCLLNRAEILASLERELSRSGREDTPTGIILAFRPFQGDQ
jgi:PleD family two-component response regulator